MSDLPIRTFQLPPEQQAIRDKCFHPSGEFIEFPMADVETSIPARFEKIVKKYSERVAINDGRRAVTYAELNATANGIARAILAQPRDDSEPVALLLNKGIKQIAAMIGVLKARRTFMMLDASLPHSRLELILEDSRPSIALGDRENSAVAESLGHLPRPVLTMEKDTANYLTEDLGLAIPADTLAAIVHTSGFTGQPKGVLCSHATLLHNTMIRTNADGLCAADRIAHLSSGTSNAITRALYALLNGAELMLFDANNEGPGRLSRWLSEHRITVCMIAAPLFRTLCEALTSAERFPDLRLLRLTSESVHKSDVDLYKKYFSHYSVLVNGLACSEADSLTTYYIGADSNALDGDVPVGYPYPGKEILLLTETGGPVDDNEIGEIVVRSKYVSPGYWRNPELTAAKFKPDPQDGEKRLYFTGDVGLMLAGGCLIHKGRKDLRVKIRGYGVEIGEVENALRNHAEIRDAVVVAKAMSEEEARLIAYVASQHESKPNVARLRHWLKTKLPDHMIPSSFVFLDALPLAPNGKVDRRALPDPGSQRPNLDYPLQPASTETERQLMAIWSAVLSIDAIGIHDNFFDLGGHSLAASRVISRVVQSFQLELPIKALFDAPTVADMAKVIERHESKASDQALARMLSEIEAMTEEEAQNQLAVQPLGRVGDRHD